jgi:hypothetical protein
MMLHADASTLPMNVGRGLVEPQSEEGGVAESVLSSIRRIGYVSEVGVFTITHAEPRARKTACQSPATLRLSRRVVFRFALSSTARTEP